MAALSRSLLGSAKASLGSHPKATNEALHSDGSPNSARLRPSALLKDGGLHRECSSLRKETPSHRSASRRLLHINATALQPKLAPPAADVDWDNLGFGLRNTDFMYVMNGKKGGEWEEGELLPFGNLSLSPSAAVLNYGQGVFEGLKAYRTEDGRVLLFRPFENARRMIQSAERMSMPAPAVDAFVAAVKATVAANAQWIPPPGKGSLYVRPLLIGSGPVLGLAPAPEYTLVVYVSPVGNYFKGGTLTPISLVVEEVYHRAAPGGTGSAKTISNYAPVLRTQLKAKEDGFSDVIYLDAVSNRYIEEVSSCNIFIVKDGVISTPDLRGTILPGITRRSIIELAQANGYKVEERLVDVDELLAADEVFCTGTAVVLSPVGSIQYRDKSANYSNGGVGPIAQELYSKLTSLQMGKSVDSMGWTMELA